MRENFSKAFEGYFQWISKAGDDICNKQFLGVTNGEFVYRFI